MNLISNCCISGYIYQFLNQEFKNPFQWCFMEPTDLLWLMTHYNKLHFSSYELIKSTEHPNSYICVIDKAVKCKFIHYIEDASTTFKINNHNVKSNNIKSYIEQKYKERLSRMTEQPVFLYLSKIHKHNTDSNENFVKVKSNFKRILICDDKNMLQYNSNNLLVIYDSNIPQTDNNRPYDYANRYYKVIAGFINNRN